MGTGVGSTGLTGLTTTSGSCLVTGKGSTCLIGFITAPGSFLSSGLGFTGLTTVFFLWIPNKL